MDIRKLIETYLSEAKLMQLATSVDGQPWVCSVWFATDDEMNMYWFSSTTRRHSQEVTKNNKVAGAVVLPHTPADKPRGLQFEGVAQLLTEQKDIAKAIAVYKDRIFPLETIQDLVANHEHHFYRIRPTKFVLFDAVNFPDNSRQEYTP